MITRNYKNLLALNLQSAGSSYGYLPIRHTSGRMWYLCPNFDSYVFPYSRASTFTTDTNAAGISVGRSTDEGSDDDYQLHDPITSGINVAVTNTYVGTDTPGEPYLRYHLTITNTTDEPITIGEIGYKQNVRAVSGPGRTDYTTVTMLLDRTVLDNPITLAGRDAGVIVYKIKTGMGYPVRGGVQMAPWALGSDEQIAAIIDAAQLGLIDLEEDAGWHVSDRRKIHISGFTTPRGTSYPEQDIELIISSFSDYNECGNVMQFDFMQAMTVLDRMNPTNSTSGGYGAMEMYEDTLPALADALPSWLKTRLIDFDVKSWNLSGQELLVAEDNKLALRALVEINGPSNRADDAEGSWIDLYKMGTWAKQKPMGYSGGSNYYWLRTPYNGSQNYIWQTNNYSSYTNLTNSYGVAAFGCV